jgi:hypothetical protein
MFLEYFSNPARTFQYDYIYIDAFFLLIWISILLYKRKYSALLFGLIIAPIIYFIDAFFWWNTFAGSTGTFIREYWIGGVQLMHPLGSYLWLKFGADFMMTISYSLFTFSWIWIMFENIKKINKKEIIKYSLIFLFFWLLIPLFSNILHFNDTLVRTVRHMDTQFFIWIINFIIAYGILLFIYRKELKTVLRIFLIGIVGALIMEIPLLIFNIRPTGINFVIFEAIFLLNQGVPWLFLIYDKILPRVKLKRTNL